jgi:hypothetical protein
MSDYGPPHNGEASKPLADWRDAEIERLRGLLREARDDLAHCEGFPYTVARIDAELGVTAEPQPACACIPPCFCRICHPKLPATPDQPGDVDAKT